MSVNPICLNNSHIVAVYPVQKNGTVIRIKNEEIRFPRWTTVGAVILFRTKNAAQSAFENLRYTEMQAFGRSWSEDPKIRAYECFVEVHGNTEEIMAAVERTFNVKLSSS